MPIVVEPVEQWHNIVLCVCCVVCVCVCALCTCVHLHPTWSSVSTGDRAITHTAIVCT